MTRHQPGQSENRPLLLDGLPRHGENPAVLALTETAVKTCSYIELADDVERMARGLAGAGVASLW